ncbi:MAG: endonuclease/exonuclease/phosphatase family metal-dependent hydrolase [Mariniblastus sp.]|jgi:endonuclease/exonuclease/phosphatase family metal-dependent hydrolase
MENSYQAPAGWRLDQTESKIREQVLELSPDFVFFQELPGLVPYIETHDMIPANTKSHSGNIATLAKHELMDGLQSTAIDGVAVVTTITDADLTLANVHLESGRHGDGARLAAFRSIINACPTRGLAVIGDTNTRTAEEPTLKEIGMKGDRPPSATWDSRSNRFREDGRKYTAFYTRYFHNQHVCVSNTKVWKQPTKSDSKSFQLSDHYAMSGSVRLASS